MTSKTTILTTSPAPRATIQAISTWIEETYLQTVDARVDYLQAGLAKLVVASEFKAQIDAIGAVCAGCNVRCEVIA